MRKIRNIFLGFGFIFILFFIYAFLGPFSKISSVELDVDEKLKTTRSYIKKEKEILSYLNSYKGKSLWQVDLKHLVKQTNAFYLGSEIYVVRRFPNRLIVFLKKKNTALLLLKDREFLYSVSYEGKIGDKKNMEEFFDFPILRGELFWDSPQLRKRALSILSSLPKTGPFFSVQNISEIFYNKINDSLLFYLISSPFILELKKQVSPEKLQNINFVLNYLNQKGSQRGFIDARLDKKIIVKHLN